MFPKFDPADMLPPGSAAPELKGLEWVSGEWKGFDAARGKRVVVAFVSVKNRNCRTVIRKLQDAVAAGNGVLAVLVHDASAEADEIQQYLEVNRVSLPVARVTAAENLGWFSPAFTAWHVTSIPTMIIVGPAGSIVNGRVEMGALDSALRPE
jgi:hypothetical protein